MSDRIVTYAQNREDIILAGFFGDEATGTYMDVGAHDPEEHSVTKYFYDRGWSGVNVEPNTKMFARLQAARPRDINVNKGISDKPGKLTLRIYDNGDGLSTFSEKMKQDYAEKTGIVTDTFHDETVEVISLRQLFEENSLSRIEFLKIDVEGYEYSVLKSNDWAKYRPEVICIEANHIVEDWHAYMQKHGYRSVFFDGLNEYLVASEASKRAEQFSYVQAVIGRRIIDADTYRELTSLHADIVALQEQLRNMRKHKKELQDYVTFLQAHIYQQQRLRNILRNLVVAVDNLIRLHLGKLAARPHYYPKVKVSGTSADAILDAIQLADARALEGHPGIGWKLRGVFGDALLWLYMGARKLGGKILRVTYRRLLRPLVRRTRR